MLGLAAPRCEISNQFLKELIRLKGFIGNSLHDTWIELLDDQEKEHHIMGFWNKALNVLSTNEDKEYLVQRYE